MYPATEEILKRFSKKRRKYFIDQMKKLDYQSPSVLQVLTRSLKDKLSEKITRSMQLLNQYGNNEENHYKLRVSFAADSLNEIEQENKNDSEEDFYSDEDPTKNNVQEDPVKELKKVNKSLGSIIKAFNMAK